LGDNTKVDFSKAMIFMTSNVGAREMSALTKPRLGFAGQGANRDTNNISEPLSTEMARGGIDAARRKITPELINRMEQMGVVRPRGGNELDRILEIELNSVGERVLNVDDRLHFVFSVTPSGKQFLLSEGTNVEYGARHLKRAIERLLVQPMSRLIASAQIQDG